MADGRRGLPVELVSRSSPATRAEGSQATEGASTQARTLAAANPAVSTREAGPMSKYVLYPDMSTKDGVALKEAYVKLTEPCLKTSGHFGSYVDGIRMARRLL